MYSCLAFGAFSVHNKALQVLFHWAPYNSKRIGWWPKSLAWMDLNGFLSSFSTIHSLNNLGLHVFLRAHPGRLVTILWTFYCLIFCTVLFTAHYYFLYIFKNIKLIGDSFVAFTFNVDDYNNPAELLWQYHLCILWCVSKTSVNIRMEGLRRFDAYNVFFFFVYKFMRGQSTQYSVS